MDGVKFHVLAPGDVVAGVPIAVSGLTRDNSLSLHVMMSPVGLQHQGQ